MSQKVYVEVLVDHAPEGRMLPKVITWEDGTRYVIDKVVDIRQAASRVGGQGDRYTIRVRGRESCLFFERNTNLTGNVIGRWFVERRTAG